MLRNNSGFDKSTRKKVVPEKASHKKTNRTCKGLEILSGLMSRNIVRGWAIIQDNQEGMNQIMEGPGRLLG